MLIRVKVFLLILLINFKIYIIIKAKRHIFVSNSRGYSPSPATQQVNQPPMAAQPINQMYPGSQQVNQGSPVPLQATQPLPTATSATNIRGFSPAPQGKVINSS